MSRPGISGAFQVTRYLARRRTGYPDPVSTSAPGLIGQPPTYALLGPISLTGLKVVDDHQENAGGHMGLTGGMATSMPAGVGEAPRAPVLLV